MTTFFEIDGSVLEGGGQILRISVSLSAVLCIPVRVTNIRSGRARPGLAAQHLKGIQLVAEMCQGKLKGAEIGSTEIEFTPNKIRGGHYTADTRTAGSISLLLQVALPCALMADGPVILELKGGTNADMAPQIDYMEQVFRKTLQKFGADFTMKILRRGYYPKGGGHVIIEVTPVSKLRKVDFSERGNIVSVEGASFVAGVLPLKMAEQMSFGAQQALKGINDKINIQAYKEKRDMAPDNCNGIVIWANLSSGLALGSDALSKRGADPFRVGQAAGGDLRRDLDCGTSVDSHAQDQIIIYMCLAEGKSVVSVGEITLHTKTAIHVAELFTKIKFTITPGENLNIIECMGLGFSNSPVSK